MPKKDGTPTKAEERQAERYKRLYALLDRMEKIQERFDALGIAVEAHAGVLNVTPEICEQILDRLEAQEMSKQTEDRLIEYALKGARPEMKHWLGEGKRGYDAADDIAQGVAVGIRRGMIEMGLRSQEPPG